MYIQKWGSCNIIEGILVDLHQENNYFSAAPLHEFVNDSYFVNQNNALPRNSCTHNRKIHLKGNVGYHDIRVLRIGGGHPVLRSI
ncbi:hypothetical protein PKNOH_S100028300 [Plasmodium knowlesi]|uniref:Uncharacterized protein n=1 Tax=Plasmodium knowlesi TaxID=5850 RepID=A0A1Y3DM27_PLAKN|nr:hypothetical protein PKNOH_S100028300 [Plasmodium knowlesi]